MQVIAHIELVGPARSGQWAAVSAIMERQGLSSLVANPLDRVPFRLPQGVYGGRVLSNLDAFARNACEALEAQLGPDAFRLLLVEAPALRALGLLPHADNLPQRIDPLPFAPLAIHEEIAAPS